MLSFIIDIIIHSHFYSLILHFFRNFDHKRSKQWRKLEKETLKGKCCAACGGNKHLQVHHIKPFHLYPELELDRNNLIVLCMGFNECHVRLGHGGNYKAYSLTVAEDAKIALKEPSRLFELCVKAKLNRKYK